MSAKKQPENSFEEAKKQLLKDRNKESQGEMSETGINRMNGPIGGVEISEQQWKAIQVDHVERNVFKKDK